MTRTRLLPRVLAVALATLAAPPSSSAGAADGAWTELPPPVRSRQAAILDPVLRRLMVFGGDVGGARWTPRNDVWVAALDGPRRWTKLTNAGEAPAERVGAAAAYDAVRRRMLLFGGLGAGGSALNDLWALSLDGTPAWTRLTPRGTAPIPRFGHTMTCDPAGDRFVVFGGWYQSFVPLNDLWQLAPGDSLAWTEIRPPDPRPPARAEHSAVLDPAGRRLVVFGGTADWWRTDGDVWSLDLDGPPAWTDLTARLPGGPRFGRAGHAAVVDPARDRMLVFGGEANEPHGPTRPDSVLALSFADSSWSVVAATGGRPSGRIWTSLLLDSLADRVLMFGGDPWDAVPVDLWTLTLSGVPQWTPLEIGGRPAYSSGPTVLDGPRGRLLRFTSPDVWACSLRDSPQWERLETAGPVPPPRDGAAAVFDPVRERLVIFGGVGRGRSPFQLGDVWALSLGGAPAWTELAPSGSGPSPRAWASMIHDPLRDRLVIYGGDSTGANNGVWELTLGAVPSWTLLTPNTGDGAPGPRTQASAIYDPLRDRMLVFGGMVPGDVVGTDWNDVWAFSLADASGWTRLPVPVDYLLLRHGHAAMYDAARDRMVVIGGARGLYMEGYRSDVWALSLGGRLRWEFLQPDGGPTPIWIRASAVADPVEDRALLDGPGAVWSLAWTQPLPSAIALESAEADAWDIVLQWRAAGATDFTAILERAAAPGAWRGVASLRPDAAGRLVWREPPAAPGARLGYRLRVTGGGRTGYYGTTWLDAPAAAPRLALEGLRPNPGTDDLAVAFTLADGSPARLELFDLEGRRALARDIEPLGPGSHVLPFATGVRLRPQLYLLRLTQGARSAAKKVAIVR
ncbi:MAG: hypothetical protein HZC42_03585 [Candidatus Eisenbacteria bacterium]|nr:hypothetical protein [Candidatus Eisenbacteria bacterium]